MTILLFTESGTTTYKLGRLEQVDRFKYLRSVVSYIRRTLEEKLITRVAATGKLFMLNAMKMGFLQKRYLPNITNNFINDLVLLT